MGVKKWFEKMLFKKKGVTPFEESPQAEETSRPIPLNAAPETQDIVLEPQWNEETWEKFVRAFKQRPEIVQVNDEKKEMLINLDALCQFRTTHSTDFPDFSTEFIEKMAKLVHKAEEDDYTIAFVADQKLSQKLQEQLFKAETTRKYRELVRDLMDKKYIEQKEGEIHINPNIPPEKRKGIQVELLAWFIRKWAKKRNLRITWGEVESPDNAFAVTFVKLLNPKTKEVCHDFIDKCIAENKGLQRTEDGRVILTEPQVLKEAYTKEGFPKAGISCTLLQKGVKDTDGKTLTFKEIWVLIALDQEKTEIDEEKREKQPLSQSEQPKSSLITSGKKQLNKYQKLLLRLRNKGHVTESKDSNGRGIITINPNFMIKKYPDEDITITTDPNFTGKGYSDEDIKALVHEIRAYARRKNCRLRCLKPKGNNPLAKALISALTLSVRLKRPQNDR